MNVLHVLALFIIVGAGFLGFRRGRSSETEFGYSLFFLAAGFVLLVLASNLPAL